MKAYCSSLAKSQSSGVGIGHFPSLWMSLPHLLKNSNFTCITSKWIYFFATYKKFELSFIHDQSINYLD